MHVTIPKPLRRKCNNFEMLFLARTLVTYVILNIIYFHPVTAYTSHCLNMSQHYNITSRNSQDQAFLTSSRINWNNKGCWLCCVNIMDLASFGGILLSRVLTAHMGKQKAATPFWDELNHNPLHGFCISENLSSYWGRSKQIVLAPWSDIISVLWN